MITECKNLCMGGQDKVLSVGDDLKVHYIADLKTCNMVAQLYVGFVSFLTLRLMHSFIA